MQTVIVLCVVCLVWVFGLVVIEATEEQSCDGTTVVYNSIPVVEVGVVMMMVGGVNLNFSVWFSYAQERSRSPANACIISNVSLGSTWGSTTSLACSGWHNSWSRVSTSLLPAPSVIGTLRGSSTSIWTRTFQSIVINS